MRKFFKYRAIFALFLLSTALFFSCRREPIELEWIYAYVKNTWKTFSPGDWLYREDVQVKAIYSNGDSRDVTERASFYPSLPMPLFIGNNEIEVYYKGKQITFSIPVYSVSLSKQEIILCGETNYEYLTADISDTDYDDILWESSDPFVAAVYDTASWWYDNEKIIRPLGNGETTITVTVIKGNNRVSATCNVVVSGIDEKEEDYAWWYYVLDTSRCSSETVNIIFNLGIEAPQTTDIGNLPSGGEVAYKWNGKDENVYKKINVDESVRQEWLDTRNQLVVYVCVPASNYYVYIYARDDDYGISGTVNFWPGDLMNVCWNY